MKILFRILVILVAASLVGGAIFAAVNVTGAGRQQGSFQRQEGSQSPQNDGGFRLDGGADHEGGRGGVLGFGFGLLKNLAVISVIVVIYLSRTRWFGKATKQVEV